MDRKRTSAKRSTVTRKDARDAFKSAKKAYDRKSSSKPKAWKKGGREWSKVLGHFGVAGAVKK